MQNNLLSESADWIGDETTDLQVKRVSSHFTKHGMNHWSALIESTTDSPVIQNGHFVRRLNENNNNDSISNSSLAESSLQPMLTSTPFVSNVSKRMHFANVLNANQSSQTSLNMNNASFNKSEARRKEPMGGECEEIKLGMRYNNHSNSSKNNENESCLTLIKQNVLTTGPEDSSDVPFEECNGRHIRNKFSPRPPTVGQSEDLEDKCQIDDIKGITTGVSSLQLQKRFYKIKNVDGNDDPNCLEVENVKGIEMSNRALDSSEYGVSSTKPDVPSVADERDPQSVCSKSLGDAGKAATDIESDLHNLPHVPTVSKHGKNKPNLPRSIAGKGNKLPSSMESDPDDVDGSLQTECQSDFRGSTPTSVSSLASSKKLEWDNGADIGYGPHCKIPCSRPYSAPNLDGALRAEPDGISIARKVLLPFSKPQLLKLRKSSVDKDTQTSLLSIHKDDEKPYDTEEIASNVCSSNSSASETHVQYLNSPDDQCFGDLADVSTQTELLFLRKDVEIQVNPLQNDGSPHSSQWSVSTGSTVRPSSDGIQNLGPSSYRIESSEDEHIMNDNKLLADSVYFKNQGIISSSILNPVECLSSADSKLEDRKVPSLHHVGNVSAYSSDSFFHGVDIEQGEEFDYFIPPDRLENMHIHSMIPPYQMKIDMHSSLESRNTSSRSQSDVSPMSPYIDEAKDNRKGLGKGQQRSELIEQTYNTQLESSAMYDSKTLLPKKVGKRESDVGLTLGLPKSESCVAGSHHVNLCHLLKSINQGGQVQGSSYSRDTEWPECTCESAESNSKSYAKRYEKNDAAFFNKLMAKNSMERDKISSYSSDQTKFDLEEEANNWKHQLSSSVLKANNLEEYCLNSNKAKLSDVRRHPHYVPSKQESQRKDVTTKKVHTQGGSSKDHNQCTKESTNTLPLLQNNNSDLKVKVHGMSDGLFGVKEARKDPLGASACHLGLPMKKSAKNPMLTSKGAASSKCYIDQRLNNASIPNTDNILPPAQYLPSVSMSRDDEKSLSSSDVEVKGSDSVIPPLVEKQKRGVIVQNSEAKIRIEGLGGVSFSLTNPPLQNGADAKNLYNTQAPSSGIYLTLSDSKTNCLFCMQEEQQKMRELDSTGGTQDRSYTGKSLCAEKKKKKKKASFSGSSCLCSSEEGSLRSSTHHHSKQHPNKAADSNLMITGANLYRSSACSTDKENSGRNTSNSGGYNETNSGSTTNFDESGTPESVQKDSANLLEKGVHKTKAANISYHRPYHHSFDPSSVHFNSRRLDKTHNSTSTNAVFPISTPLEKSYFPSVYGGSHNSISTVPSSSPSTLCNPEKVKESFSYSNDEKSDKIGKEVASNSYKSSSNEQKSKPSRNDDVSQSRDDKMRNSLPLSEIGDSNSRGASQRDKIQSQRKKQEVEKLRSLVERQKQNYRRRLRRELQRLEQLEEQILSELEQHASGQNCTATENYLHQSKHPKSLELPAVSSAIISTVSNSMPVLIKEKEPLQSPVHSYRETALTLSLSSSSGQNHSSERLNTVMEQKQMQMQPANIESQSEVSKTNSKVHKNGSIAVGDITGKKNLKNRETQTSQSLELQASRLDPDNPHSPNASQETHHDHQINEATTEVENLVEPSSPAKSSVNSNCFSPKRKAQTKVKTRRRIGSHRKTSSMELTRPVQRSIAWFIPCVQNKKGRAISKDTLPNGIASMKTMASCRDRHECFSCKTLQEAFYKHCGHLIKRSEGRLQRIAHLAEVRRNRTSLALKKAKYMKTMSRNKAQYKSAVGNVEPAPRTFTHKEMREQTERLYQMLPEVILYRENKKKEEQHKMNRLMAHLFKKRLQEQALKGRVSWTITQSCL